MYRDCTWYRRYQYSRVRYRALLAYRYISDVLIVVTYNSQNCEIRRTSEAHVPMLVYVDFYRTRSHHVSSRRMINDILMITI